MCAFNQCVPCVNASLSCICACMCVRLLYISASLWLHTHMCENVCVCVCCAMFEQVMETGFSHEGKQSQIPECKVVVRGSPMRLPGCAAAIPDPDALFKLTYTVALVQANMQLDVSDLFHL